MTSRGILKGWPLVSGQPSDFVPLFDPARFTFWATRVRFPSGTLVTAASTTNYVMTRIVMNGPSYAKRNPRFHFSGFASTEGSNSPQETVLPGNGKIIDGVWVSVNDGPPIALTFGGAAGVTIASGSVGTWTDEIPLLIPAEAQVAVWTLYHTAAAEKQIPVYRIQAHRGERVWGATDAASLMAMLASPGTPSTPSLNTGYGQSQPSYYGPDMTVARGWNGKPVLVCAVDSIGEGRQEYAIEADTRGNWGWLRRWLDQADPTYGRTPHFMMGMPGAGSARELGTNATLRWQVLDQANAFNTDGALVWTRPLNQLGQNDLQTNYATMQANYSGFLDRFAARYPSSPKFIPVGVLPRTTSTDAFQSRASQTPSTGNEWAAGASPWGGGSKWQLEAFKQSGAGGKLSGYIDTRPAFLDPAPSPGQSPATWPATFGTTLTMQSGIDGVTPYTALVVNDKPVIGTALGIGGSAFTVSKVEGNGPYTITDLSGTMRAALFPAGTALVGRASPEGVHPYSQMIALIVASIPQSNKAQF